MARRWTAASATLRPSRSCLSIAGVPVGLDAHGLERQSKQVRLSRTCMRLLPGKQIAVRRYEPEEAEAVIEQAEAWQRDFRRERGDTFFHLGDEFYLMCGATGAAGRALRRLSANRRRNRHHPAFPRESRTLPGRSKAGGLAGATATVACGTLIGPTMRGAIDDLNGISARQLTFA